MTTVAEILNRAADRLSREGAWTQNAMAKDADGTQVPPRYATACQWCSKGAIRAETKYFYDVYVAEQALASAIGNAAIAAWNDDPARTQSDIVEAFRKEEKL